MRTCAGNTSGPFSRQRTVIFSSDMIRVPSEYPRESLRSSRGLRNHCSFLRPRRQYAHANLAGTFLGAIDALRGDDEIFLLGEEDVRHIFLRIAVDQWEPRTVDLHHDAMAFLEGMQDILQGQLDPRGLIGFEGLRLVRVADITVVGVL